MPVQHIRLKRGISFFRRKVPTDLRRQLGLNEIIRSLGRVPAREARRQATQLWLRTEQIFMALRQRPSLTRKEISLLEKAAAKELDFNLKVQLAAINPDEQIEHLDHPTSRAAQANARAAALKIALKRNNLVPLAEETREIVKKGFKKNIAAGSQDERLAARIIMQTMEEAERKAAATFGEMDIPVSASDRTEITEYELDIDFDEFVKSPPDKQIDILTEFEKKLPTQDSAVSAPYSGAAILPTPPGGVQLRDENKKFSKLAEKFIKRKLQNEEWKPGSAADARQTYQLWMALKSDLPPKNYTGDDATDFIDQLKNLPSDYYSAKEFRDVYEKQGVRALLDYVAKQERKTGKEIPKISIKTRNAHVSNLNGFFTWCAKPEEDGYSLPKGTHSIFGKRHVKVKKPKIGKRIEQDRRRIFKPDEIRTLLATPMITGCRSERRWKDKGELVFRNENYWVFLIALLHGMRLSEPTFLRVKHVKHEYGVWYFDLLDEKLAPLLKGIGSPREVPIHNYLLAIGFLEARVYGRDAEQRLLPEAVSYSANGNGGPIGQWFLRFRRSCNIDDPKLDFHAFRHTVVTGLNNVGIPQTHIEEIVGHESGERRSEFDQYNHGVKLKILKRGINKFKIPFDADAINAAITRSDQNDRSAAWPNLKDPNIVPKRRRKSIKAKRP